VPGDIDLYDEFIVSEMLYKRLIPVSMTLREFGIALKEHYEQIYTRFCKTMTSLFWIVLAIISDCSALVASDFYLLPTKSESLSIVGIQLLERRIAKLKVMRERLN